jgi:mycothiol synthase
VEAKRVTQASAEPVPGMPLDGVHVEVTGQLRPSAVDEVFRIVAAATEADRVGPLSEHVRLHLRNGGDPEGGRHVLLYAHGRLAGYGHLDVTDTFKGSSAELVVDPLQRGNGYGRELVARLVRESPDGRLRLWAHGLQPAAKQVAATMGFTRSRELWRMQRPLSIPLPPVKVPPGVTVRTFRPGADDEAWVALNAVAFADHPEQGRLTLADLHRRMAEPWFDPHGFFLAERDGELVGFHWTKVHGGQDADGRPDGHGHEPIGEVYVVGVHPDHHGGGLGRALTLTGLHHLDRQDLTRAMLYVDARNGPAIRVYTTLGFQRVDRDVMFSRSA